jgi:hypothetical protein
MRIGKFDASPSAPALDPQHAHGLLGIVSGGDAILFTGAGFSIGARDSAGTPLPDTDQMRHELWRMVFGNDQLDDSTLQDLYDVALERVPDELERYLDARLRVGSVPTDHHATWFALPWRRIYTLNVDDLEAAIQREVELPRPLYTVSAVTASNDDIPGAYRNRIDVIHLNGVARDGARALTFSTLQYAERLCGRDHKYVALSEDLARWPFVFAGTTLGEVVLWQHLELYRRGSGCRLPAKPSYLVARTLSRARQLLLKELGVIWLATTIEEISRMFAPLVQRSHDSRPHGSHLHL